MLVIYWNCNSCVDWLIGPVARDQALGKTPKK